jgi:hypothetical protein
MLKFAQSVSLAALAILLLAACGSSSSKTASQTAASVQNEGIVYASCIRSHGVPNFPDPGSNGGGGLRIQQSRTSGSGASMTVNGVPISAPAFRGAQQACAKYMPKPRPIGATQVSNLGQAAVEMASCMRSHGVPNFPDPSVSSGPGGGISVRISGGAGGPNSSSPAFQAAEKTCMPIMQKAGGPPGVP